MAYHLPAKYRENPGPVYFLDDVTSTRGIVFQAAVYEEAERLAVELGIERIIDVGCGWGDKLAKLHEAHPDWIIEGVDYGDNIEHCRQTHPWGRWHEADLDGDALSASLTGAPPAVVICADVVEHVLDPDRLLRKLANLGQPIVVLSTPAREVQYPKGHMGPPQNLCHVREWRSSEFAKVVQDAGFTILSHELVPGSDQTSVAATQMVVCG